MIYSSSGATAARLAVGTSTQVLTSTGTAPSWATLDMSYIPGASYKKSVRVATTANITLSAPQTIDGIAVVANDRVLVKDQSSAATNGIYVVQAAAWTRATDADAIAEIAGALVAVDEGTTNGGKVFTNRLKVTDTLGTTVMPWYEILDSNSSLNGTNITTGTVADARIDSTLARLASPTFTGTPAAPTAASSTNSTQIATTAFVKSLFGSASTSGTLDWNDATNTIPGTGPTLLMGNATNGPGVAIYFHPLNIEYSGKSGTGNVTQIAIPYGNNATDLWIRGRYSGVWGSWNRIYTSANSSFQPLDADLTAIASLAGTSGLLKKTAADTWTLDTTTYLASSSYTASDVLSKLLTVDGSGSSLDADKLDGIDLAQIFNNMGNNHSTYTSFDATTPSYGHGFRFVQGSTNGPATGGSQFYTWYIGLGNEYPATGAGSYGAMFAVDRNVATPYLSVRYNEANTFGTWRKVAAGYADSAGNADTLDGQHGAYYATDSLVVHKAGTETITGAKTVSAQLKSSSAWNAATGGGQILLDGATGNRIDFSQTGANPPAFTTRSVGTKIVLFPAIAADSVDFALGIDNYTLWQSVGRSDSSFKWYAGTTNIATLSGTGVLALRSAGTDPNASDATYLWNQAGVGPTISGYQFSVRTGLTGAQGERMRIDSAGRVGIGAAPSYQLDVISTNPTRGIAARITNGSLSGQTGSQLMFEQGNVGYWTIGQPAGTHAFAIWKDRYGSGDGTEYFRIDSAGNVTLGGTISASGLAGSLLSSFSPNMDGTGWVGDSAIPARQNHVHPSDTSRAADSAVVHLAGTETITGAKTFSTNNLTLSGVDFLMGDTLGDRITLYGTHDAASSYALGIEAGTLYSRSSVRHRWYIGNVADAGVSARMTFDGTGLGIGMAPDAPLNVAMPGGGAHGAMFRHLTGTNNPGLWMYAVEASNEFRVRSSSSTGSDKLVFGTGSVNPILTLDNNGYSTFASRVGIGISPSYPLHVNSAASTEGRVTTSSASSYAAWIASADSATKNSVVYTGGSTKTGTLFGVNQANLSAFYANNLPMVVGTVDAFALVLGTSNTERMRIDSSGNVGIGGTAADSSYRLHVRDANAMVQIEGTSGYGMLGIKGSGTNSTYLYFRNASGGEQGLIRSDNGGIMQFWVGSGAMTEKLRLDGTGVVASAPVYADDIRSISLIMRAF